MTNRLRFAFHLPFLALTIAIFFGLTIAATQPAQAQTFTVLHSFTGGQDGGYPFSGVTLNAAGNLYGTAGGGGNQNCENGCGAVFSLKRGGSDWIFAPLYDFTGGSDGYAPFAGITIGPNGTLYGTTIYGGNNGCDGVGCGTVFNVTPPASVCRSTLCYWNNTVLYPFPGQPQAGNPYRAYLVFDTMGNAYGVTEGGGLLNRGAVYELTLSNGGWTASVLYSFAGGADGEFPTDGVLLDGSGNLYGTTVQGGMYQNGKVYELTYTSSGWVEKSIYDFQGSPDGIGPSGIVFDGSGNIYGTTASGGVGGGGTVYELTPQMNGTWTFTLLYSFQGPSESGPLAPPTVDAAGNVYDTTHGMACPPTCGTVFKLSPTQSGWEYTDLHDFSEYGSDGCFPWSDVVFDASGNLFGTTSACGTHGAGSVWEITP